MPSFPFMIHSGQTGGRASSNSLVRILHLGYAGSEGFFHD